MKRFNPIVLSAIICLYFTTASNANSTDSLLSIFKNVKYSEETRLNAIKTIDWSTLDHKKENGHDLISTAIQLSVKKKDNSTLIECYLADGLFYLLENDFENTEKKYKQALKSALQNKLDKKEVTVYLKLAELYRRKGDYNSQLVYINKVLNNKLSNEVIEFKESAFTEMGQMYLYTGEFNKAIPYFHQCLEIVNTPGFKNADKRRGYQQENLGNTYYSLWNNDSTYYWIKRAINTYKKIDYKPGYANTMYNLGSIYFYNSQYDSSIDVLIEAQKLQKTIGNKTTEALILQMIGNAYSKLKMPHRSLPYYLQSIQILEKGEANYYLAKAHQTLANYYLENKEATLALKSFKNGMEKAQLLNNIDDRANISEGMARAYLALNNLGLANQFKAQALLLSYQSQDPFVKASVYLTAAKVEHQSGKYQSAILYADSALLQEASLNGNIDAFQIKYKSLEKLGLFREALQTQNKYLQLLDSATRLSNLELEQTILAKYSLEKAEMNEAIAKNKNRAMQVEVSKHKQFILFVFVLLGLALISLILLRIKHKKFIIQKERSSQLEIEKATEIINHSRQILQNQSALILEKNRIIADLKSSLQGFFENDAVKMEKMESMIDAKILTKDDWESFKNNFNLVYPSFIATLETKFEKITESELRMFCLLKLGLQNDEMAEMLGVLPQSIKKTIYRFTTKYSIENDQELSELIKRVS